MSYVGSDYVAIHAAFTTDLYSDGHWIMNWNREWNGRMKNGMER